jgi:hypothetical protein
MVGDAAGQTVRCGIDVGSGQWFLRVIAGPAAEAVPITVAEVVDQLPASVPRGWAFGQTRRYIAAIAGEVHRLAAASPVHQPGMQMTTAQMVEAAERIGRLARELDEAAAAPVKSRAEEAFPERPSQDGHPEIGSRSEPGLPEADGFA